MRLDLSCFLCHNGAGEILILQELLIYEKN
jgi:hypothetical protein